MSASACRGASLAVDRSGPSYSAIGHAVAGRSAKSPARRGPERRRSPVRGCSAPARRTGDQRQLFLPAHCLTIPATQRVPLPHNSCYPRRGDLDRPMAQAWAIARCDNPRSCLSRRISRIFLIDSLAAGIASPSLRKGVACRDQGYRQAFTITGSGVQLLRIRCSTSRIGCSTSADPVFNFGWIRRSRSAGLRTRTKGKDESGVRYVKRNAIAGHRFEGLPQNLWAGVRFF